MDLKLKDKLALVSGSTAGIGFAIAGALAGEGARVIVNGRTQPAVDAAVASLRSDTGAEVEGFAGDLTTASRQNATLQASVLRDTSPVLAELVKQKKLAIRSAMYDVGSGKVTMLAA